MSGFSGIMPGIRAREVPDKDIPNPFTVGDLKIISARENASLSGSTWFHRKQWYG